MDAILLAILAVLAVRIMLGRPPVPIRPFMERLDDYQAIEITFNRGHKRRVRIARWITQRYFERIHREDFKSNKTRK